MKYLIKLLKKVTTVLMVAIVFSTFSFDCFALEIDTVFNDADWNNYVEQYIEEDNVPGISFVAVSGDDMRIKSWGFTDLTEETPVSDETAFQIGSCSKAFTALAVLLLQEEGKLSIDDSVSAHIPWWRVTYQGQEADVKIWHLLNHCSGIPDSETMAKIPYGTDPSLTEKTARIAENFELSHAPGELYEYCNLGYDILAYLTETVSGMSFSEFVTQEILQPIGMVHSGYGLPTASGHIDFFGKKKGYIDPPAKGMEGDGLLITTSADMALWLRAQLGQLDLPEDLRNAILASHELSGSHQPISPAWRPYYNGWHSESNSVFSHSGQNPAFTARIIIDTENDIGVFSVSNCVTDATNYPLQVCYKMIVGNKPGSFYSFPEIRYSTMKSYDRMATYMASASAVLLIISLVMLVTQKRRLARRKSSSTSENTFFIVRMIILLPLLGGTLYLPRQFGKMAGYSGMGYTRLWYWGAHSAVIACLILDAALVCMILSVCSRYVIAKRTEKCQQ